MLFMKWVNLLKTGRKMMTDFRALCAELLQATENKYKTTEKGRAHIQQLCTLPLPSSVWIDSNGKPIELN